MGEKPSITGFLKGMLGFRASESETVGNDPPGNSVTAPLPAIQSNPTNPGFAERGSEEMGPTAPNQSNRVTPQTEAYQNRKKGRKRHGDSIEDLKRIIAAIQRRGETTPGELAKELGMARSTLAYNLNRFLAYSPDYVVTRKDYWENHLLHYLLGQKRMERTGAGPSLRYRLVDIPQAGSPMEPAQPSLKSGFEAPTQVAGSPSEPPPQGNEQEGTK